LILSNWGRDNDPVLIILDAFDDPASLDDIRQTAPARFHFLLTAREPVRGIKSIDLPLPEPSEGFLIFKEAVENDAVVVNEEDAARKLCAWLGQLPLALRLVGGYLQTSRQISKTPIASLLSELQENGLSDPSLMGPDVNGIAREGVAAAIAVSWYRLSDNEQRMACLLSLFAPAPIPFALIESAAAIEPTWSGYNADFRNLLNRYLLDPVDSKSYQLHQLVREFFHSKLNERADADDLKKRVGHALAVAARSVPETMTLKNIADFTAITSHAEEACQFIALKVDEHDFLPPFQALRCFYDGQNLYEEANFWANQGLLLAKARFGDDHLITTLARIEQGLALHFSNQMQEAAQFYLKAIAVSRAHLPGYQPALTRALIRLAALRRSERNLDEALELAREALRIREGIHESDPVAIAEAKLTLATIEYDQNRDGPSAILEQIAADASDVLATLETHLPEKHPDINEAKNLRAVLLDKLGKHGEAKDLFEETVDFNEQYLYEGHPSTAVSYHNLAKCYHALSDPENAVDYFAKAATLFRALNWPVFLGQCQLNHGLAEIDNGNEATAKELVMEADKLLKDSLPESHAIRQRCADILEKIQSNQN
jgi:tetratricopeptide (TPR) repeat protein